MNMTAADSRALRVRAREQADLARIVSWIPDGETLYLFTGPRLSWPLTEAKLAALEETAGLSAWVLVDSAVPGRPLAHFDITLAGREARLGRVVVDPMRRGRGLGAATTRSALAKAGELGATRMTLNVIDGNLPAIRSYEKLGFEREEGNVRSDVIRMAVDLD